MPRLIAGNETSDTQLINDLRRSVGYFQPDPKARQLGGHGVMLGYMPDLDAHVAVKPFSKLSKAMKEHNSLQRAAEKDVNAFEPLLLSTGGLATYLITRRVYGVDTLASLPWRANVASSLVRTALAPGLLRAGVVLAGWHNVGIAHGDYQPRNVMFAKGAPIFGDAEKSVMDARGAHRALVNSGDLRSFGYQTLMGGLLGDRSPSYRAGMLGDNFVDPYLEAVVVPPFSDTAEGRAQLVDFYTQVARKPVRGSSSPQSS